MENNLLDIFLNDHISQEITNREFPNGCILIYKGFPIDFIVKTAGKFSFINAPEDILKGGKLNLQFILDHNRETIQKLFNIKSGIHVLTYEELLMVSEKVDLSLFNPDILIFDNNLLKEYPAQVIAEIPDLDNIVEKTDMSFQENNLINHFYAYSASKFGINLIQYKDINVKEENKGEIHNFFKEDLLSSISLDYSEIQEGEPLKEEILAIDTDENYFRLKNSIFLGYKINSQITVVTDHFSIKRSYIENELKILKLIFEKNGYKFNIKVKVPLEPLKHRHDFDKILERYWDSNSFRELIFYEDPDVTKKKNCITQGTLIEEVVQEAEKANLGTDFSDIFITAPTGAGKSLLFQIPAIYLAEKYSLMTIIVSPLKSLMYDQVMALKERGIQFAAFINSDIPLIERENIIRDIKSGKVSILYLSPELLLSYDVRQFIGDRKLGLLAIDEAHLVTTWGRDFRIDYWYLGTYIKRLRKYINSKFPVLALTATAIYKGKEDIVFQTIESLNMQTPKLHIGNTRRDEITFNIRKFSYERSHELKKLEKTKVVIVNNINENKKTIVYFPWVNQIKFLLQDTPFEYKEKIGEYYGDAEKTQKQIVQDKFKTGEVLVVLATKAFGMGIDVRDIEVIYHHAPSGSLSDYVQEIGRVARKKEVKGYAITDFCDKDLKFTKILYGLSSLKQYQIKFVLQKLYDLYKLHNQRQMLVSVEDFGFVFPNAQDLETKVKSALLLLEKDLLLKVNSLYNVIMVRPKSIFSIVYGCIPLSIEKKFLLKYGDFCKRVATVKDNTMRYIGNSSMCDVGDIYEIHLDKIWERFFSRESFPSVKRDFFNKTLFTEFSEQPFPRYKLRIFLNQTPRETIEKIENYFSSIDKVFKDLRGKQFTTDELRKKLSTEYKNEVLARRVATLITSLYSAPSEYDQINQPFSNDVFLQAKRDNSGKDIYRLLINKYFNVKYWLMKKFDLIFDTQSQNFEKFIDTKQSKEEYSIKIAYLIESFLLGNYELSGGQLTQIFIRINEPFKLGLFSEDKSYSNVILQDIERRHDVSVKIMADFFNREMTNSQRWDYVEDYFLGKIEIQP